MRGVRAVLLGSAQTDSQAEKRAMAGEYQLIYVTPEKFSSFNLSQLQSRCGLSLVAIDEAHCVCEWGFDFRPSCAASPSPDIQPTYSNPKSGNVSDVTLGANRPHGVPLMALTATAPPTLRAAMCASLKLARDAVHVCGSLARPNLHYSVERKGSDAASDLLPLLSDEAGATIVYVATQREAKEIGEALGACGVSVGVFFGGGSGARLDVVHRFVRDQLQVVVATVAFGMGIDKPDVRQVQPSFIAMLRPTPAHLALCALKGHPLRPTAIGGELLSAKRQGGARRSSGQVCAL